MSIGCGSGEPPSPPTDVNVVLISIDTWRADRMSLYGYDRPTTPFLEEFAKEAVVFDRFFHSGGGTLPSHMTMMTSLNPRTHFIHPGNQRVLEDERITLAEQLKDVGYTTAAFTDGGWMRGKFGFTQGFDSFDDGAGRFKRILPKAYEWLDEHSQEKFFLFLHTYDVHSEHKTKLPYSCPGGLELTYVDPSVTTFDGCRHDKCATYLLTWINSQVKDEGAMASDFFEPEEIEYISSLYDGCINYVDEKIAEIVGVLKEKGVYDETLLIITSDHGEEFAEHGLFLHDQGGFEEYVWMPLIMRFPDGRYGGQRIEHWGALVDLMPTVLDFLHVPVNDHAQGSSLMPSIVEDRPVRHDVHFYDVLKVDNWKYFSSKKMLFDVAADPREVVNIYDQHPEVVSMLETRVRDLIRIDIQAYDEFQAAITAPTGEVELSDEEKENLKALGYLTD
jgi:arylsulfatase A-like enzyme